ncbi:ArnT family glycosyltransferase [Haloarcula salina]|uniref:ArnT family glycosyltransferase n=1 Tax=Haloarcula salina TaxID=1429914 RepID=UPI003C702F5D
MKRLRRPAVQAGVVAVLGGLVVFALAHLVFPHHTTNHDEGVYLQQAAMLLEGQLFLYPPVEETFRPWFFVTDGGRLYPKYAPVPAAMFAVGKLLGGYRVALALIAAGALALTYHTAREAFDEQTGVVASALMLGSPLFLIDASVFLSYVPTMLWNLGFAAAYLRADRTGSRRTAALAGLSVGLAFFARPYTAVLFASPFIVHALWRLRTLDRARVQRLTVTAVCGLTGVAATLAYNRVVTGSALLFPYEAFAPLDGLGFGYREIRGYSREFTPAMSLDANAELLWKLATQWVVAGPLGTLAALGGVAAALRRGLDSRQAALAGVFLSVPLGNLYFWGTVNMLGDLGDPTDGLVAFLGPFYHVDVLVPTAAFGAVGVLAATRWFRAAVAEQVSGDRLRPALVVATLCLAAVGGGATVAAAAGPVSDNYAVTQQFEQAYEPFEERDLDGALVFLPTPYGQWLNHPFQAVRNDPGFDGDTVYAMQHRQFDVVDAYPDRTYYRYVYRGEWVPYLGRAVEPRLQRVTVAEGEAVRTDVAATVPEQAALVSIRLTNGEESDYATVRGTEPLDLRLVTDRNSTRLAGEGIEEAVTVATPEDGTVTLVMFVDYGTGAGFTYRADLPVERTDGGVKTLTPRLEVCTVPRRCGGQAAYVPGSHREGIGMNATTTVRKTEG